MLVQATAGDDPAQYQGFQSGEVIGSVLLPAGALIGELRFFKSGRDFRNICQVVIFSTVLILIEVMNVTVMVVALVEQNAFLGQLGFSAFVLTVLIISTELKFGAVMKISRALEPAKESTPVQQVEAEWQE